ncbi:MAG: glycosyltransferase family 39 protein [Vicinamibacterales bacterium]
MGQRDGWWPFAVIAAPFVIGWMLVAPWQNVPVIDDWAYAWSVEHLLRTGHLAVSDRSSIYPIAQILWGWLFARVAGGFSFGILRLSTVVVATVGCWAVYLFLRELAFGVAVSVLAALTLALYPAYFVLSFTFMTDVPFVALSAVAMYFYVAGVRRDRPPLLWWAALFALLAFLVRQVGIVLPCAAFAAIDRSAFTRRAIARFWVPLIVGAAIIGGAWIVLPHLFGGLPVIELREQNAQGLTFLDPSDYASWNIELLFIVAFPWAALLLCPMLRWKRFLLIAAVAILIAAGARLLTGSVPTPLPDQDTWSVQDMAMRTNLVGGDLPPSPWVARVTPALEAAGALVAASLIVGLGWLRKSEWRAGRIIVAGGLLNLLVINILWVYYDRYYLILAPTLAYLASAPLLDTRVGRWPAAIVLVFWASLGIPGTRAVIATNAAVARMTLDQEQQGTRMIDIDAGYSLNAWRLYAHPENLPPGLDPHADIPFVSNDAAAPYAIVTTPGPGDDVIETQALPSAWWQRQGHLYLVHRRP